MTDWADKLSETLYLKYPLEIATALRKVKADGYLEGAHAWGGLQGSDLILSGKIEKQADKIERGES